MLSTKASKETSSEDRLIKVMIRHRRSDFKDMNERLQSKFVETLRNWQGDGKAGFAAPSG